VTREGMAPTLPSVSDFADALAEQIGRDARDERTSTGQALALAAAFLAGDVADSGDFERWLRSRSGLRRLRTLRRVQVGGIEVLR